MKNMKKVCLKCGNNFEIFKEDLDLYEKVSPVFLGKKYSLPEPTECPFCRFISKAIFRNEHTYYRTKSSLSGKSLISVYAPTSPYKVFSFDEWWSDKWNALDYGRDFDFGRGFFEQFAELFVDVPKINLIQDGTSVNCEYTNFGAGNKNCYMTLGLATEDSYHCIDIMISKDCTDCLHIVKCEKLYECVSCENCYNSKYLNRCEQCSDSLFLDNCISCKNCIGCKNLRHKEFCVFNKQYSKDEYFKILEDCGFDTHEGVEKFRKEFEVFRLKYPYLYASHRLSENSTGEFLDGAKNCHQCFIVLMGAENCRYCFVIGRQCKDIIDCNSTEGELNYLTDGLLNCHKVICSHFIRNCSEIFYSMFCYNSQNLFGCTGLDRKQYCIFNKQYTRQEYENLVPKIIEHMRAPASACEGQGAAWGKYFPPELSAFGYNETFAFDMNPLSKEDALKFGFKWADYEQDIGAGGENCIICEETGKPFRLIKQEVDFYNKNGIPFPKVHPDVRIERRYRVRNPNKFWERACAKCGAEIVTTYDPERPEIVYCEKCYLGEIY